MKPAAKLTEAAFMGMVIELARLHRWRVAHFRPGMDRRGRWRTAVQGDGVGFPDLILVRGARLVAAELKVGRRRLTPEQQEWLGALGLVPGVTAALWTPSDWPAIESTLRG